MPEPDMRRLAHLATLCLPLVLVTGCELFGGGESAEQLAAKRESEGKAVGGACRHAGRAIEDCFALNKRADKAAVFAGWREMNDYMRDNKMEILAPQQAAAPAETSAKLDAAPAAADSPKKAAEPSGEKATEKGKKHAS
jgi:hypothetical protein